MSLPPLASFVRAALALALPVLLVASCGGNVIVEDPQPTCDPGLTSCGGECVSLNNDLLNCGSCNAGCFEGTCSGGVCQGFNTCPPSLINCFGSCVDPSSDPANCGGCGIPCPSGSCSFGSCDIGECFCGSICSVISLGSSVPQTAFASTVNLPDQWVPTCVSGSGSDVVFSFFAPQSGQYTFVTFGSSVPHVLEVLDPGCGSFACSGTGGGFLSVFLSGGQHVLVAVDTLGQQGEVQLDISLEGGGQCVGCAEFITSGDPGPGLCPGSAQIYDVLASCICVEKCPMYCADLCNGTGGDLPPECQKCIQDTNQGCGNELNDCTNDF